MKPSKRFMGSAQWFNRHVSDGFVHQAQLRNYLCRSAFKLTHLDDILHLFDKEKTHVVIDLGCAPGSWSQVASERLQAESIIIAVDLNQMKGYVPNTVFIQGDFTSLTIQRRLNDELQRRGVDRRVDVVMSDMSPNRSGNMHRDIYSIASLNEKALSFALTELSVDGHFVCKVLGSSPTFPQLLENVKRNFRDYKLIKPPASREESAESYLVGLSRLEEARSLSRYNGDKYGLDDWPGSERTRVYKQRRKK